MNELTDEEYRAIWSQIPIPPEHFYRLYYDDLGCPLFYSMEDHPGNYIEIDRETFVNSATNVRVVNGKLTIIKHSAVHKLVPGSSGTACHPDDVTIVVNENNSNIKWILK